MAIDQAAFLRIALRGGRFLATEQHIETMARELGTPADVVRQWLALVRRSEPASPAIGQDGAGSGPTG